MNVLLFADVGGFPRGYAHLNPPQSYVHIGDEAMMFETFKSYQNVHAVNSLGVLTWEYAYKEISAATYPHYVWPTGRFERRLHLFSFTLKLIVWRVLRVDAFTAGQKQYIQTLSHYDRIHFSGGGNITSIFPSFLYYSLFTIVASRLLGKEVVMTSQTIGPFKLIDYPFIFLLNLTHRIGIRGEKTAEAKRILMKWGIVFPEIFGMSDVSFVRSITKKRFKGEYLKIGISLHAWGDLTEEKITEKIKDIVQSLSSRYQIKIVLLPHTIGSGNKGSDSAFYQKLSQTLFPLCPVDLILPDKKLSRLQMVEKIKEETGKVDVLLTSRYHGLVFALSQSVPALSLSPDSYYETKNNSLLKQVYGKNWQHYQLSL